MTPSEHEILWSMDFRAITYYPSGAIIAIRGKYNTLTFKSEEHLNQWIERQKPIDINKYKIT